MRVSEWMHDDGSDGSDDDYDSCDNSDDDDDDDDDDDEDDDDDGVSRVGQMPVGSRVPTGGPVIGRPVGGYFLKWHAHPTSS